MLYEIGEPDYLNPDVTAHFGTIQLAQAGPDRVAVTGTRGSPPPSTLKVALNMLGGYRNTTTMVLTGLDIEAKAAHAEKLLFDLLGGADQFDEVDVRLLRFDHPDAARARDDRAYEWLRRELTVDRFRELLTEAAHLGVQRYELPNLRALNFVVAGLLAPGVAATTRPDAQAKGLGEYLRSRVVAVPRDVAEEVSGA